jgi:hypothetical protein
MLSIIFSGLAVLTCLLLMGYLAYSGWQDMKAHEIK